MIKVFAVISVCSAILSLSGALVMEVCGFNSARVTKAKAVTVIGTIVAFIAVYVSTL